VNLEFADYIVYILLFDSVIRHYLGSVSCQHLCSSDYMQSSKFTSAFSFT